MGNYGTWIVARTDTPLSRTQVIRRLSGKGFEDDPVLTGWVCGCTREAPSRRWYQGEADINALADFVDELAVEVDGQVAAGWCEDGDLFAGCLSGGGRDKPLLFGFGLEAAPAYEIGEPFVDALRDRWGDPWQTQAAPAITAWLQAISPTVTVASVDSLLRESEETLVFANEGLFELMTLAGFGDAEGQDA